MHQPSSISNLVLEEKEEKKFEENDEMAQNASLAINSSNTDIASEWVKEKIMPICNPLVVILGIGEYDEWPNLIGVKKDYENMIKIFNKLFKYDILYKLSNNQFNDNKSNGNINDSFKLKWLSDDDGLDEVLEFVDDVKIALSTKNKNYDSLIFIISCHGEADGVIFDSVGEEHSLPNIYTTFNGEKFPDFAHCPKLFFVDACRGTLRRKPIKVEYKMDEDSKEIYVSPKGKENEYKNDDNKSDNKNNNKKLVSKEMNIHEVANFYIVYANPEGYAAFDAGPKGGYLIQAIYKVFRKKEILSQNLIGIKNHIGEKVNQLVGKHATQHVETVSTVHYRIKFRRRQHL